jgi:hypothetical protein
MPFVSTIAFGGIAHDSELDRMMCDSPLKKVMIILP